MAKLRKKSFDKPDEKGTPPKVRADTVKVGDFKLTRITYEPGWRWSTDMKPIAGTKSCQKHHILYSISGRMAVILDDGTKMEFGEGDIVEVPSGHDGWVIGKEPAVVLEFGSLP
jgi:mannose-6-phosphate isomerase-like protein (cupin superfamily)